MIKYIVAGMIAILILPFAPLYSTAYGEKGDAAVERESGDQNTQQNQNQLESIIDDLEKKYAGKHFSAEFHQESTLSALDISDTAEGKAWFQHPGKMRWEYRSPEQHVIVTDGETLWIHRPDENQVIKGDAAAHFGDGQGAGFLSNFNVVTERFDVSLIKETDTHWHLKLVPHDQQYELSAIYLHVNQETSDIERVVTENIYEDTTTISFDNFDFSSDIDPARFDLEIPEGTDIIRMDE